MASLVTTQFIYLPFAPRILSLVQLPFLVVDINQKQNLKHILSDYTTKKLKVEITKMAKIKTLKTGKCLWDGLDGTFLQVV